MIIERDETNWRPFLVNFLSFVNTTLNFYSKWGSSLYDCVTSLLIKIVNSLKNYLKQTHILIDNYTEKMNDSLKSNNNKKKSESGYLHSI